MKTILLNTRPTSEASQTKSLFLKHNIDCHSVPVYELTEKNEWTSTLPDVHHIQGLFFSSKNGFDLFFNQLSFSPPLYEQWAKKPIYTLSKAVVQHAESRHLTVQFSSQQKSIQGFLSECPSFKDQHWLHPCSQLTKLNPIDFTAHHINITNLPIYQPQPNQKEKEHLVQELKQVKGILFFSGSAVSCFLSLLNHQLDGLQGLKIFSIGLSSAEKLLENGITTFYQTSLDEDWVHHITQLLQE